MASPAEILRVILIQAGIVEFPGAPQDVQIPKPQCTIPSMPNDPDVVVTLANTAGILFGRIQDTGEDVQHFGIKVNCRHTDEGPSYDLMKSIHTAVAAWRGPAIVNVRGMACRVDSVYNNGSIITIGEEENTKRFLYSLNVRMAMPQLAQTPLE